MLFIQQELMKMTKIRDKSYENSLKERVLLNFSAT